MPADLTHPQPASGRVHVLPEAVAILIAAGEVVERPASVVKELVENSLDAGALRVDIDLEEAGLRRIRVTDDGGGMSPEDAVLAFARHATSKISGADDLNHISTFGFRGEALAAIAAVAKVDMLTRPGQASAGFRVRLEGGRILDQGDAGCAAGTSVDILDLFYNTPARRKFLKSQSTEQAHAARVVEWAALANPGVAFALTLDQRPVLTCPAADSMLDRIAAIYGHELPSRLLPVDRVAGSWRLQGWVASPSMSRPTRQDLLVFVNGRPIEHRGITHAVFSAYRPQLPAGRFPVGFLFITVPAEDVDVNVHPAKREVRFKNESRVHDFVEGAVRSGLGQGSSGAKATGPGAESPGPASGPSPGLGAEPAWSGQRVQEAMATYLRGHDPGEAWLGRGVPFGQGTPSPEAPAAPEAPAVERILGQVGRTYIAAQDAEGFFLVDQHAVHERWLYDELRRRSGPIGRQALLVPVPLELNSARGSWLEANRGVFADLGMDIAAMGKNDYRIQSQPDVWGQGDLGALVVEVIDWALDYGKNLSLAELRDQAMKSLACHSAVRAGDRLMPEDLRSLLDKLSRLDPPWTCPHGRPFIIRWRWQDLDKLFKRT